MVAVGKFSRLKLLSSISVLSLILAGAVTPAFADEPTVTHTITDDQLCADSGDGFISLVGNDLTVDLSKTPDSATSVVVDGDAGATCARMLETVTFLGGDDSLVTSLTISDNAFQQIVLDGSSPLESVIFPEGLTTLEIGGGAFLQESSDDNSLKTVTFPNSLKNLTIGNGAFRQGAGVSNALETLSFPVGLETLSIGDYAFHQTAYGSNALQTLTFPDALDTLTIGVSAFLQDSTTGSNALKTLTFPKDMDSLTIGDSAFFQTASHGSNALQAVVFPNYLSTLNIGESAFSQEAYYGSNTLSVLAFGGDLETLNIDRWAFRQSATGGSNALEYVFFPEKLKNLDINDGAFFQKTPDGKNALKNLSLPAGLATLGIGVQAFYRENLAEESIPNLSVVFRGATIPFNGAGSVYLRDEIVDSKGQLFWYGITSTSDAAWTDSLITGSFSYDLVGYREVTLSLNGGNLNGSETATAYVYTSGDSSAPSSGFKAGFTNVYPLKDGEYLLKLSAPTKDGNTFAGWCAEDVTDADDCSALIAADATYTVDDATPAPTLFAVWEAVVAPMAPVIVATPGDGEVVVTWGPVAEGTSVLTGYKVEYGVAGSGVWDSVLVGPAELIATVPALTNGTAYDFRVTAVSGDGVGVSDIVVSTPVKAVVGPDAPVIVATPGDGEVVVTWGAVDEGTSVLDRYTVEYRETVGAGVWSAILVGPAELIATVPALTNGTEYEFRVTAVSGAGFGVSGIVVATPVKTVVAPIAPVIVSAVGGDKQVVVDWVAPVDDGGSLVTGYTVQYKKVADSSWDTFPTVGTGLTATVTGLDDDTEYEFQVLATNGVGSSVYSAPKSATTDAAVSLPVAPDAPVIVSAVGGDKQVVVDWVAPVDDGGSLVTGYTVQYKKVADSSWDTFPTVGTGLTATVTGLDDDTEYEFQVLATNGVGSSVYSAPKSATTDAAVSLPVAPIAPVIVSAVGGDKQVVVDWVAPVDDGGSLVTGYTVQYKKVADSSWDTFPTVGTGLTATVTGLDDGTEYEFQVLATNGVGSSVYSAPKSATTDAAVSLPVAPDAPVIVATPGDGEVVVTWGAVDEGTSVLDRYTVEYRETVGAGVWSAILVGPAELIATVPALTNGTEYEFRVTAVSGAGFGVSGIVVATPVKTVVAPIAPVIVSAVGGDKQVVVDWVAPVDDGGSLVTGYTVQYKKVADSSWDTFPTVGTGLTATVTGLDDDTEYEFQVLATNGVGSSVYSAPKSATTDAAVSLPVAPDAPVIVSAVGGDKQVVVDWVAPVDDGGSLVTGYTVQYKKVADSSWDTFPTVGTGLTATVTGLDDDTEYEFQVLATNGVGSSVYSAPKSATTDAAVSLPVAPDAPVIVSAVGGDKQVVVDWVAPVDDGGSLVTGYTVQYKKVADSSWDTFPTVGTGLTATVTGLDDDTEYEFQVLATNGVGSSVYSAPKSATTDAAVSLPVAPDAPVIVSAVGGDKQVVVDWVAPVDDGGSLVTGYTVQYKKVADSSWDTFPTVGTGLTATVTGLDDDTEYEFQVLATNGVGSSVYSAPKSATTNPATQGKTLTVSRVFGDDRYLTSLDLNDDRMVAGAPVFVATGVSYPDALSAGPAVVGAKGSLVLTGKAKMDQRMVDLIASKKPSVIYVIGGVNSVSDAVMKQLKAIATVERVAGTDRYETSTKIFDRFFDGKTLDGAFVATGLSYPDALSASAAGGTLNRPVLLVNNNSGVSLNAAVTQKLKAQGVTTVQVVGGTSTVSTTIEAKLKASGFGIERLQGTDRYQTNLKINEMLNTKLGSMPTGIWIATGKNFPDALSGAVPAGSTTERLVLSNGSCIPSPVVSKWIKVPNSTVTQVTLVGGVATLSKAVFDLTECK